MAAPVPEIMDIPRICSLSPQRRELHDEAVNGRIKLSRVIASISHTDFTIINCNKETAHLQSELPSSNNCVACACALRHKAVRWRPLGQG
jgi:hypothetical protein